MVWKSFYEIITVGIFCLMKPWVGIQYEVLSKADYYNIML